MKNSIKLAALAGAVTLFSACADDVTNVYNENSGMSVLEKGKKLSKQACDSSRVGEMLYVTDSAAAYFCNGKKWEPLKGEDGEDGKDGNTCSVKQSKDKSVTTITCETKDGKVSYDVKNGADGEDGKNGKDGVDGKNGKNGKDGADGDDCKVVENEDGSVSVVCGDGEDASSVVFFKDFCGDVPYDPATQICDTRDNQLYETVKIGTQTWMAENLNYEMAVNIDGYTYRRGICAGRGVGGGEDCDTYGRLYTWAAAMDSAAMFSGTAGNCGYGEACYPNHDKTNSTYIRGICPAGWHLPTDEEWRVLVDEVGGIDIAGKMLKSTTKWTTPPAPGYTLLVGSDDYGFNALPGGDITRKRTQGDAGLYVTYWTSSKAVAADDDNENAQALRLSYDSDGVLMLDLFRDNGYSVRCLKDN